MTQSNANDANGFGRLVGHLLIGASISLVLVLAFFRTRWYTPPYSEYLFAILFLVALLGPVPAITGTILVMARRRPGWGITATAGLATIGASSALGFACCLGSPTGVSFDQTRGFELHPDDTLHIQDLYNPDVLVTADSPTLKAVVTSLENATRISQDGSEHRFTCTIERNGNVVLRFDAMTSGNIIVEERLYQGPPKLHDFLMQNLN